jgi:hypothetical protein
MNTITRGDTSPTARRAAIVLPAHPNVARLSRKGADVKAGVRSLETMKNPEAGTNYAMLRLIGVFGMFSKKLQNNLAEHFGLFNTGNVSSSLN